ncbi:hypothetical protein K443DRAFT_8581 [Laccaria amethystina LaAM-08-1]|uniref:Uncharacterized protein n=1 Tax=Laccaria amethystina LaAM-08-1 TaxID=1095629 RepID=A0A0C9XCF6_9AGAR|nr:hypothetical protein K443DRAFT_8581 [Laccaria amethystina LaAM-08-1]
MFAILTLTVCNSHQLEGLASLSGAYDTPETIANPGQFPNKDMVVNHPTTADQLVLQSPRSIDLLSPPITPHF